MTALICRFFISLVISGFGGSTEAFTFQEVAAFTNAPVGPAAPANPAGGLIQGTDGNFYGTSFAGGNFGLGTVFQMTSNGVVTVLASFNGTNGANPRGTMVTDNAGNFYGVTYGGGIQTNEGTVFKISMTGNLTVLHDFYADPGKNPYAGLLQGMDGNFYGTTESYGTVFKITPSGVFSNLSTYFGLNGESLNSVLTQGSDGYLYGVAGLKGFSAQGGVFFKLSTNGGMPTVVSQFAGTNGDKPFGGLTPWLGNYIGTTVSGGAYGLGSIFTTGTGVSNAYILRDYFNGLNGAYSYAPFMVSPFIYNLGSVYLFGGTATGGPSGQGVVFSYDVYNGYIGRVFFNGANGSGVYGQMVWSADGFVYGTTRFGGLYGRGTAFRTDTFGHFTSLTSFPQSDTPQPAYGGLIQTSNGDFYGITTQIGPDDAAGIFQLTPGGALGIFATLTNVPAAASD
ncbi:MAG TPA: choice-of-anchor tandem repeat GloVer-containing protein, partial [Verrucomicrobiae bacterium]|nr:choice-of-anchor tandem repeat GloVer-containing protein [Verrucomicrobiae bacterium]